MEGFKITWYTKLKVSKCSYLKHAHSLYALFQLEHIFRMNYREVWACRNVLDSSAYRKYYHCCYIWISIHFFILGCAKNMDSILWGVHTNCHVSRINTTLVLTINMKPWWLLLLFWTMSDVLIRLQFDAACDRHGYHIILAEGRKN